MCPRVLNANWKRKTNNGHKIGKFLRKQKIVVRNSWKKNSNRCKAICMSEWRARESDGEWERKIVVNMCAWSTHENRIIVEIICRSSENSVSSGRRKERMKSGRTEARYDHFEYKFYFMLIGRICSYIAEWTVPEFVQREWLIIFDLW